MKRSHSSTLLPATLTALTLALGAMAVPHDASACHKAHDPCDGGGGPGDVATNDTKASWRGPDLSEDADRACALEYVNTDGTFGRYVCVFGATTGNIDFALTGAQELDKRGREVVLSSGLCDGFDNAHMPPNTNYFYEWSGLCGSDSGCAVRIVTWHNDLLSAPNAEQTGLLIVESSGTAFATAPTDNQNPFAKLQNIDIKSVLITVKEDGTNKTLRYCDYDTVDATFGSTPN